MRKIRRFDDSRIALFALAALGICFSIIFAASCTPKYPEGLYAEVTTNKGLFVFRIEFEKTPMTAANFVGLAEGTIANAALPPGTPYFNGVKWHRVVPGHVIQCGIPKDGKREDPGYEFPNEIVPGLSHGKLGMVNMANGGPHTNGSEWCVMLGDRSYLDGDYTVWGEVIQGLDIVTSIVQGDEIQTVKIVRIGKAAKAFHPTTESFKKMVEDAWVRVKKEDIERKTQEDTAVAAGWPQAVAGENGLKYIILKEGRGKLLAPGAKIRVAYSGKCLLSGKAFVSTEEEGIPYWGEIPAAFEYEIGKTKVNPGFDASVAAMKKGEKRLVIVPSEQGYGLSGLYTKQRPGEKRFIISPRTMLVYEIEILD
ncbi:MAG: peptidylprolyl isomerase [Candidatus Aminicenantes bacterium]|nr:peptidylprolyl isomerase [Candidatus Aminicenantes bacterium]